MTQFYIDKIIKTAITEDINYIDAATDNLFDESDCCEAIFVSKAEGVLAGLNIAMRVFELLDSAFESKKYFKDGDRVRKGDVIVRFSGKTSALLKGERTALNLLQHLSGIATMTAAAVEKTAGTRAVISDTRKTMPGLRAMQKYAVTCGGGKNHRFNLSDAAMLKDNHIDAAGSIKAAVEAVRKKAGHMIKIEVETRSLSEVCQALEAGAETIMLDNMSCEEMAQAVKKGNGRALFEASGNVTLETVSKIAATGVDIISMGALTHSVTAFDISMKYQKNI